MNEPERVAERAAAVARALQSELGPGTMVEIVSFGRVATRVATPDVGPAHATIAARDEISWRVRNEEQGAVTSQNGALLGCAEPIRVAGSIVAVLSAWFPDPPDGDEASRLLELAAIGLASWWERQEQRRDYELAWTIDAGRARDQERRRLAYDLHGSVAQELAAARVSLNAAEEASACDPSEAQTAIAAAGAHVHTAQSQTRQLIEALGARAAEDQALAELVEAICREYESKLSLRHSTVVALTLSGVPASTSSVLNETVAFVLREALQNVYEHAGASNVEVALTGGGGRLTLQVIDDGCGVPERRPPDGRVHLGVQGIRERIRAVGGSVSFESQPGAGTRITVAIPV